MARVLIINGHPDADTPHFCDALIEAFLAGAHAAGHEVRVIDVARINFDLLTSAKQYNDGSVDPAIEACQRDILWSNRLLVVFPLWLGGMPAKLKGFWEQTLRPKFILDSGRMDDVFSRRTLKGRTVQLVVTMGMPAFVYRWYFGAHGIRGLVRNVLKFSGLKPVKVTYIGRIGALNEHQRARWLQRLRQLGERR